MLLGRDSGVTGRRVGDLQMPEGSLLISVLRSGKGFVPTADTVLEEGDEVLAVLDPGKEEDLKVLFGPNGNGSDDGGLTARSTSCSIGGGMASAHCAAELRKRGAEGSILLVGREPEPPYERPPISKEYLRGEAERADAYVNPPSWYEENGVELLSGPQRDVARPRGAHGEGPGRGGGRLRQGADRHRGDGQHPPRRGRRERGHPLPARLRQLRRDPRRGRGGRARGPDRRQLHRHRGRRLADREGHQVLDRGDGGRGALAHLRRRRRALVPGEDRRPTASSSTAARSWRPSRATAGSGRW